MEAGLEEFVYQQVLDFLSVTGGQSILSVNMITVGKSLDDNERKTGKCRKWAAIMLVHCLDCCYGLCKNHHIMHEKYMRITRPVTRQDSSPDIAHFVSGKF